MTSSAVIANMILFSLQTSNILSSSRITDPSAVLAATKGTLSFSFSISLLVLTLDSPLVLLSELTMRSVAALRAHARVASTPHLTINVPLDVTTTTSFCDV